jgi:hypothetical protein
VRPGPIKAILELLWEELEAVARALPEHLQDELPDYLREDSPAPA